MDWSSTLGTLFAVLLFVQNPQVQALLPAELSLYIRRRLRRLFNFFNEYVYFTLDEYDGVNPNELYSAAQLHLSAAASSAARSASLTLPKNAAAPTCTIADNERIVDEFGGCKIEWHFTASERTQPPGGYSRAAVPNEKRALRMRIHKKDRDRILSSYIPHIRCSADTLRLQRRERLLFTNLTNKDDYESRWSGKVWNSVPFKHPSNFHTLALDPPFKESIQEDLRQFTTAKDFYNGVGRAWKRGYLLYGPPGTGKSSMIAAMANFLEYDVYDLELTEVKSNCQLRNLLVKTTNRSIIVIEDIDCSLDLTNERKKKNEKKKKEDKGGSGSPNPDDKRDSMVTLSGLLNFVDGLWSCVGEERIFVFTTNHVERIDKALLRPGRMDMHIELSYCCFEAFKILARNYLGIKEEHPLFEDVRVAMAEEGAQITPAEVSEVLTRERRDIEVALRTLVKEVKESKFKRQAEREEEERKKKEIEDAEKEEEEEEKKKQVEEKKKKEVKEEVEKKLEKMNKEKKKVEVDDKDEEDKEEEKDKEDENEEDEINKSNETVDNVNKDEEKLFGNKKTNRVAEQCENNGNSSSKTKEKTGNLTSIQNGYSNQNALEEQMKNMTKSVKTKGGENGDLQNGGKQNDDLQKEDKSTT